MTRTLIGRIVAAGVMLSCAGSWAHGQDVEIQYPRAVLVAFDPIVESSGGQRLHTVAGWGEPFALTNSYVNDFEYSSHGIVNYRLTQRLRLDVYPLLEDGFRYDDDTYYDCRTSPNWSGCHNSGRDYRAMSREFDWARKCDAGMIDEVFDHSAPYFAGYETRMLGYGGYWCNSSAQQYIASSKIFIVSVFNYERGVDCMVHDQGHRIESIMRKVYGTWSMTNPQHLWDRFTLNKGTSGGAGINVFGVGNCHYPMNGDSDYDYTNTQYVDCTAPLWLTMDPADPGDFPDLTGPTTSLNREAWGGSDYHRNYINWMFYHMPHFDGTNSKDGYTRLNNWWEYFQNFNAHSHSGGDHIPGGTVPPATPYTGPQRTLSDKANDDWCPRANAAGRVVWYGHDGGDFEIYSMNLDGTDWVQITSNGDDDEAPEINASGRIVWQGFDGVDFEIFSANADGSDLVQLTDNGWNDWHPQINDNGVVVWEGFDGDDYEIFTANADGTNVVQITSNYASSGKPRDDVWPVINNANPARVAWFGYDGSDWEVFSAYADGSDLSNVSNHYRDDEYPQINDSGRIVWHRWDSTYDAEILSANQDGSNRTQLTSNSNHDWWPQINNSNEVVWMTRVNSNWEIYRRGATGGTTTQITANTQHDQYPQIDAAGRITWQGFDGADWEIYVYDGGTIYQVTDNDHHDRWPYLAGPDTIVWHGEVPDGGPTTTEIFAAGTETTDTTPPELESVQAIGSDEVRATFSEALDVASAETAANYEITPSISVLSAELLVGEATVVLTTSALTSGETYTLTVNDVTDVAGNPIAPDTEDTFDYQEYSRVSDGLVVLYGFDEGSGNTVHDISEIGTPLDLDVYDPGAVSWTADGLVLNSPTRVQSPGAGTKVIDACMATDEITIEAWVIPTSVDQYGPARIVTCSTSSSSCNFTLGQGQSNGSLPRDVFDARLRTTETSGSGEPSLTTATGTATPALTHLLYTRAVDGTTTLHVDGVPMASGVCNGTFVGWNAGYRLVLGGEVIGSAPWLGEYKLVAIYDRALTPAEAVQNYLAGPSLAPDLKAGDCNCDGDVDYFDINYFLEALNGETGWSDYYESQNGSPPPCDYLNCDCDGDSDVDYFDINAFLNLLGS